MTGTLKIGEISPGPAWDDVVRADGGLVFASAGYLSLIADVLPAAEPHHLGAFAGERLVAVMPGFDRADTTLGRVANSSPFFGSHGGVYCALTGDARDDAVRRLLQAWTTATRDRGCALATVVEPLTSRDTAIYAEVLRPWLTDDRIGQVVEGIPHEADDLYALYHQKTRNAVRKAAKEGVTVRASREPGDLRFLYDLHVESMAALRGRAKRWEFFSGLGDHLPEDGWELLVAEQGGRRIAALLLLAFGDCVEYFTPATRPQSRAAQPMSLLVHHGLLRAARSGRTRFNFGGTWRSQAGVFRFKSRFGAGTHPYAYYVQQHRSAPLLDRPLTEVLESFEGFYLYPANDPSSPTRVSDDPTEP